jgi:hypothetical protein
VTARRLFYEADLERRKARSPVIAMQLYMDDRALPAWKNILLAHPEFRRDEFVQEESYEIQRNYLALARNMIGAKRLEGLLNLQQCLARGSLCPPAGPERWFVPQKVMRVPVPGSPVGDALLAPVFRGPLDDMADDGRPILLPESTIEVEKRVAQRLYGR